jgi:DDE family transposase
MHDFPDQRLGKAIPYGIYDLGANTGWVGVGTDHDTAAFAVACLRGWWDAVVLITAGQPTGPGSGPDTASRPTAWSRSPHSSEQ